MKKYLLILVSCFLLLDSASAQAPNWLWAKGMGGTSVDDGYSVTTDDSDNVYTTGNFYGTVDFDPGAGVFNMTSSGSTDVFISKFDSAGNFIWAKKFGGINQDEGRNIAADAYHNVYISGSFQSTVDFDPGAGVYNLTSAGSLSCFISKLDISGNFLWAKAIGGNTATATGRGMGIDVSANVYTAGIFQGTIDCDPGAGIFNLIAAGGNDVFLSKLDSSGNFLWAKRMGGINVDNVFALTISSAPNADVYTTGVFNGPSDFDPGPGIFNITPAGGEDVFISKLDSSGNFIWAKQIGGTDTDQGWSIAVDPSGSGAVYTTGFFKGTADFDPGAGTYNLTSTGGPLDADIFISKLDASGNFVWAKRMGGIGSDIAYSIVIEAASNTTYIYTTGFFYVTVDFDPSAATYNLSSAGLTDIFLSKLDSSGNFVWAKRMGGTGSDGGYSMALGASGNLYMTGNYSSPVIAFSSTVLTGFGNSDIFVSKLDSPFSGSTGNNNEIENADKSILVFPNPFTTTATIRLDKEIRDGSVRLINLFGQTVLEKNNINGDKFILHRDNLGSGIYVYEVTEKGNRIFSGKAVVY